MYHRRAPRRASAIPTDSAGFFHPLDARVAGGIGCTAAQDFVQYQFVTPNAATVHRILHALQHARTPVLLAVLKRFGAASPAPLSFPAPGWTLALDIPADTAGLNAVLDATDRMVLESGGRVYLAKDARVAPDVFEAMYQPGLASWRDTRSAADPLGVFRSDLARRLHL